jgi:hypothetical protein
MEIKETYHFSPQDFDINGNRKSDGLPFREVLREFECDFHARHSDYYALFLFANSKTMLILSHSCNAKPNMIYGMDLIEGDFEPNTNHCIEEAGSKKNIVVYGIDSAYMLPDESGIPKIDEEKMVFPLTLFIDNELKNGVLQLKYLDDDDKNDENCDTPINVDENSFKFIKWK